MPDAIAIRREAEALLEALQDVPTEEEARALLVELNERIGRTNSATVAGPPTTLALLDVERTLEKFWRHRRTGALAPPRAPR